MKTRVPYFLIICFVFIVSCSGYPTFEDEMKKIAYYRCELQHLRDIEDPDEELRAKIERLEAEMEEYAQKLEEKYHDDKNNKAIEEKAEKIIDEEMEKCK